MLPLILGAGAVLLGAAGVSAYDDAKETNEQAERRMRQAKSLFDDAKREMENEQKRVEPALENFANDKGRVMAGSMGKFLDIYEKIDVPDTAKFAKINKPVEGAFVIDKAGALQMRELSQCYVSALTGGVLGAVAGGVVGGATLNVARLVLGGMGVGGLGLGAVGAATLFSTPMAMLAGPAVLFSGCAASVQADENLEKAETVYAEAEAKAEKMKATATLCRGIVTRTNMFDGLLNRLDGLFNSCVGTLGDVVEKHAALSGNNNKVSAGMFSDQEFELLAVTYSLAGAMREVLCVPILTEDGKLAVEPVRINEVRKALPQFADQTKDVQEALANSLDNDVSEVKNVSKPKKVIGYKCHICGRMYENGDYCPYCHSVKNKFAVPQYEK